MDLAELNSLSDTEASRLLTSVCAAPRWVDEMVASRPYETAEELIHVADHVLGQFGREDLDAALAGHPKIGAAPTGSGHDQSRLEQSGVDADDVQLATELAEGNRAYEERFGRIYLVCASGRTGPELLEILRVRLTNDPVSELAVTQSELGKINRLRLERLVGS